MAAKPSGKLAAPLAIAVLAGCSARISAGVAVDTSGGVGPRIGIATGYGTPRVGGRRVRRPSGSVGVAFPGGDESTVDVTLGYERLMLPPEIRGVAYRLGVGAGWLRRSSQDENLHRDLLVVTGSAAIAHARANKRRTDPNRRRHWYRLAPMPTVRWQQYGVELGVLGAGEPSLDNGFGLAHLSAMFEISSWPDRR